MSMRGRQAYKNLTKYLYTLKTICGSGASWTRCNFSLCSNPHSIPSRWLSPGSLGTPTPSSTHSIPRHGFPQQTHALASNLPHPVSLDAPFFLTVEYRVSSRCPLAVSMPPLMILQISVLSSQHLSLFQADGVLLIIWYICFLPTEKWHWPPLVLSRNYFLSEIKLLGKGNKFIVSMSHIHVWMPEYKSHFSLNRIQDVSNVAIWLTFFSHHFGLSKKFTYFHIFLVFFGEGRDVRFESYFTCEDPRYSEHSHKWYSSTILER